MNKTEKKFKDNLTIILDMIKNKKPKRDICRLLSIKQDTLNNYFKKYDIVYSGNQGRKGMTNIKKQLPYTEYTENNKNINSSRLRVILIQQGVKDNKCESCGLDTWMEKPIPLELHHIDQNRFNNKLDNLMILCSNCHMQQHNYSNVLKLTKQRKEKIKNYCECGSEIKSKSKYCVNCNKTQKRKKERPPHEKLLIEIKKMGYAGVGKKYGVSDNSIRKWVKFYEKNN